MDFNLLIAQVKALNNKSFHCLSPQIGFEFANSPGKKLYKTKAFVASQRPTIPTNSESCNKNDEKF